MRVTMSKIIFIDRDGVINKDLWRYVEHPGEFEFLPGVLDGLKLLTDNNYQVVVVSNQAGVGDGKFSEEALKEVDVHMIEEAKKVGASITKTYYCIHGKYAGCDCRKPEIGLFEKAALDLPQLEREKAYYIGDKDSDIKAGKRFGLKTILVRTGYGQKTEEGLCSELTPEFVADDLKAAIEYVIAGT